MTLTLRRISKREAKRRFFAGEQILFCPNKFHPYPPFSMAIEMGGERFREEWFRQASRYDPTNDADVFKQGKGPPHEVPATSVAALWKGSLEETAWALAYNNWAYYNLVEGSEYAHYYVEV